MRGRPGATLSSPVQRGRWPRSGRRGLSGAQTSPKFVALTRPSATNLVAQAPPTPLKTQAQKITGPRQSDPSRGRVILRVISPERPLPEFWYPVARILLVLNALLLAAAPGGFARISARVNRELIYAGAFARRYLLAVARGLVLPPLRARAPAAPTSTPRSRRRPLERPLPLAEPPARRRNPGLQRGAPSSPETEWALALQRTEALLAALRRPLPLARRLARRLARGAAPTLRDLAIPWHIIRALPAALDILLMQLDRRARPDHWSAIPDTG